MRCPGSVVEGRKYRGSKEEDGTILRTAALQCELDEEENTIRVSFISSFGHVLARD